MYKSEPKHESLTWPVDLGPCCCNIPCGLLSFRCRICNNRQRQRSIHRLPQPLALLVQPCFGMVSLQRVLNLEVF